MSALVIDLQNPTKFQLWKWTEEKSQAAICLATGGTRDEAAAAASVDRTTIYEWLKHPDFQAEIDRLSLMVHVASRAERLRIAMRVVKSKLKNEEPDTDRDLLDWLKFAQSETDGVKIDLTKLAAIAENETPVADSRQGRLPSAPETEDAGTDSA